MWATGVLSRITLIASPALCSPLTADSLPAPGPFRFTSHSFIPNAMASLAAFFAALVAAKAEDFRDPVKFALPAELEDTTFPARSVIEIMVLLNVALT